MTNKPKRHHFLAEMYLEGFREGKFVQVYHRDHKKIVPQTPVNTAVQGYLYQRIDHSGNKLVDAEEYLSKLETASV